MTLTNFFLADPVLWTHLEPRLRGGEAKRLEGLLQEMGEVAAGELDALAHEANANPPTLKRYDRFGDRVDEVHHVPAYDRMREIAYESGLVWRGYAEASEGGVSRPGQFALSYVFAQAEQGLYCPVCLTDGTALLTDRYADEATREAVLPRLLADDVGDLWEGAMFLTETAGGSDVGANETVAKPTGDGAWELHGRKWFCSNAGAESWMVLARPAGAPEGTRGLGLFLVPRVLEDGSRNDFRLERLKDKLGTRSMATGEIELTGTRAIMLGGPGEGFERMAEMLTLSRVHNSVASAAAARRALVESVTYGREREAFGKRLVDHPLHRAVLVDLSLEWEASLVLALECASQMEDAWFPNRWGDDGEEAPDSERAERILRSLTPLAKLYTAKVAVEAASEACENLGGNGYVEEFVTPRLLRDAQVLPIWEGTTNILSLDVLRAAREGALVTLVETLAERLREAPVDREGAAQPLTGRMAVVATRLEELGELSQEEAQVGARDLAMDLARVACAVLLGERADAERGRLVFEAYVEKHFGSPTDRSVRDEAALEHFDVVVGEAVRER